MREEGEHVRDRVALEGLVWEGLQLPRRPPLLEGERDRLLTQLQGEFRVLGTERTHGL